MICRGLGFPEGLANTVVATFNSLVVSTRDSFHANETAAFYDAMKFAALGRLAAWLPGELESVLSTGKLELRFKQRSQPSNPDVTR